ncbi:hypothetical protein LJR130_001058 [Variovorax sp. LjRoot130]
MKSKVLAVLEPAAGASASTVTVEDAVMLAARRCRPRRGPLESAA